MMNKDGENLDANDIFLQALRRVEYEANVVKNLCGQMGNNDVEFDLIRDIVERFKAKKISEEEAVRELHNVWWKKQDF